ncbi:hypothetical protein JMN32_08005 [Fulvivirga sp. 29W222]|uniref:Cytochrome c family protein n=1 Tax=Fulvivirga marina TaxID=2494733 RepID=A0A937FWZ7_9BACT|nr:hypothetical protein [Fulvivirga marina]MBL6446247.1 hypothetical protein [Fulvivirga marina]
MKTKFSYHLTLLILTITFTSCLYSCKKSKEPINDEAGRGDTYAIVEDVESNCNPAWFPHSQTPPPMEGNGSPFDTTSTTNSIFHEWSWQKFLWLTKPMDNGKTLFEDSLTLVTNELLPIEPIEGVALVLTDVGQAGSDGVLISNESFNGQTDTVYYGIYANNILLEVADSMKSVILNDTSKVSNTATFPVGALEVKTSWVQASTIPSGQQSDYYLTKAYITPLQDTATVALLGVHVVGVVKNHPEFIWATFEHNSLAGRYDWASTTDQDVPVTSNENLMFFAKGDTATIKNITYTKSTSSAAENVFTVFQYGIPRTAENAIMPHTSQDSATNLSNYNNIVRLNECVSESLSDVWKNYFYNGSVWINTDGLTHDQQVELMIKAGGSIGSADSTSSARGSLAAFNITMETFAQTFGVSQIHTMDASQVFNCMGCHTTVATVTVGKSTFKNSKSPLYFSHIFRSYLSVSSGVSVDEIEKLRIQEFIDVLERETDFNKK